jgi:serine/threonine protein kinase
VSAKHHTPTTAGAGDHLGHGAPRQRQPTQPYGTRLDRRHEPPHDPGSTQDAWRLEGLFLHDRRPPASARPIDPILPAHLFARPRNSGRAPAAEVRSPELGAGAIVDKYRIESLLGVGGFAVVYLATHLLLRTQVALKMLRPQLLRRSPALATALCQEARLAARIDHPNVVRVFDVTHGPELSYVVMEYVEGQALARTIRDHGAVAPSAVVGIGLDVAAGLRAGLDQGVVHRDIKPANIILTPLQRAKIVDLGLASTIATAGSANGGPALVGTQGYMAPELAAQPAAVDFRADIYSLGVTLYHAAVGRLPFPSDDARVCLQMHCDAPVPPPHTVQPAVPERLSEVLLWMLEKRPSDRPESYEALRRALRRVLRYLPNHLTPDARDD